MLVLMQQYQNTSAMNMFHTVLYMDILIFHVAVHTDCVFVCS